MAATSLTFGVAVGRSLGSDFLCRDETGSAKIQKTMVSFGFSRCCSYCGMSISPLPRFRGAKVVSNPLSAQT